MATKSHVKVNADAKSRVPLRTTIHLNRRLYVPHANPQVGEKN